MSSDERAIGVEGLGKRYRLGATAGVRSSYRSLREDLVGAFAARRGSRAEPRHLWALRDVSFEVAPGERRRHHRPQRRRARARC